MFLDSRREDKRFWTEWLLLNKQNCPSGFTVKFLYANKINTFDDLGGSIVAKFI
jgi:hypothetical protein